MMIGRLVIGLSFVLAAALPAVAERIEAGFEINAVTVYSDLALVERTVVFEVGPGLHEVIIPGLPYETEAAGVRIAPPEGVAVLSSRVAQGRLPMVGPMVGAVQAAGAGAEVRAAEAEITRLEAALRAAQSEVAAILLREAAAQEQIRFLRSLGQGAADGPLSPARLDEIRALGALVGDMALGAETAAHTARQDAADAEQEVEVLEEALARAHQALEALWLAQDSTARLILALEATEAGEVTLVISTITLAAQWTPTYDMLLDSETGALRVVRGVTVEQSSGEDWTDVALRLSTARPSGQHAPQAVRGRIARIVSHEELARIAALNASRLGGQATEIVEAPFVQVTPSAPGRIEYQGATVVYDFPHPVDVRDGVDALRLALDTLSFGADLVAEAVPARDDVAYLMARFDNTSDEILLPGPVLLYRDGALVGAGEIARVPAGGEVAMGFGAIDGLLIERRVTSQSEGEQGLVSAVNSRERRVILEVENLTERVWDVVLRDGVGYSQQDDLQINVEARPAITRVAPGDLRGVVEWDLTVPAGETAQVEVIETTTWPLAYDLR